MFEWNRRRGMLASVVNIREHGLSPNIITIIPFIQGLLMIHYEMHSHAQACANVLLDS
jgi:hypothetical protein